MKKIRIFISILLTVILIIQIPVVTKASNITVNDDVAFTQEKNMFVYNTPIDESESISDNNSKLLSKSDSKSLPVSVDLSESSYFPPVRNQCNIGNCASWATAYYQFGFQVAKEFSLNINSTYNQFSPKWVHNLAVNNTTNEGITIGEAYQVLSSNGTVRYSQFTPTDVQVEDPATEYVPWYLNTSALETALKYRVSNYEFLNFAKIGSENTPITSYNSSCLNNMKAFLADGKILTILTDFGENNSDWIYGTLSNQSDSSLNGKYICIGADNICAGYQGHAMSIVGYNDNITYDLNGNGTIQSFERGAFKVVNSHGTKWKNDGFIWVLYDALNKTSNVSKIYTDRRPAFYNYQYYVIDVKEYSRDLIAKVKLNHSYRKQIYLCLGVSETNFAGPTTTIPAMLLQKSQSANVNFSGVGTNAEDATFVFDFGDFFNLSTGRKNCYIRINDSKSSGDTKVKRVELIDGTGKTVKLDTEQQVLGGISKTYIFKVGAVGDVNNDAKITISDASKIQKYLSQTTTLTNDDLLVADVNGDGAVTIKDVSDIQKYLSFEIDEFDNGSVVLLE